MLLAFFIYLASQMANIQALFVLLSKVSVGLLIVSIIIVFFTLNDKTFKELLSGKSENPHVRKVSKRIRRTVALSIISLSVSYLLPSERTMYMMAAGYVGQSVIQSEEISKIRTIINLKLDATKKELEQKKAEMPDKKAN